MKSLPTLRRKILRSFLFLVGLYAILGAVLVASVRLAGEATPRLLHSNYDSIAAADQMKEAWVALRFPTYSTAHDANHWIDQFERALNEEAGNITEPGERDIETAIRKRWASTKNSVPQISQVEFEAMRSDFRKLILANENGMFLLVRSNDRLGDRVLLGTLAYFVLSLILSVLFADKLAQRLSSPIKAIAEALHRRPSTSRKLPLPEATNLEMLILTTELARLWDRLSEGERVNVAEIVQQKTKLETLLESVDDGLLVLDPHGRVSHCNECLAKLVSLSPGAIQGQLWNDLPVMNSNYLKLRSALRVEMSDSLQVELEWNGGLAFFSARLRRIGTAENDGGVLYLLHDITEKKQRDKFRSEFIDLLSHELKTPLQSLGTASELLTARKAAFPEDLKGLVEVISEDVERIKGVAQEFVQVTQSHSKVMKLKLEVVAVNQVLPEWLKPFGVIAKDRGVRVEFVSEGSDVVWCSLDLIKFPWVISNLVSNAIRFSPSGAAVTVVLSDRNNGIEFRVQDEGPGVPEADQDRIFEAFYQSPVTTASGSRGLFGVGLTIAKEVVEAHDGRIEYRRLSPHGSEFRILLPFPPFHVREGDSV